VFRHVTTVQLMSPSQTLKYNRTESVNSNDMRYTPPDDRCDVLEIEQYGECRVVEESFMKTHLLFQRVVVMVTDRCAQVTCLML
jgi:hypothetical protein